MSQEFPMRRLCRTLQVSPSCFYAWQQRQTQPGARTLQDARLLERIAKIHQESRQTYGSPRIERVLRGQGFRHGRNRIARLMRRQQLQGRQRRRYRVCTTDSRHDLPVAPNRLASQGPTQRINEVWVADLTYIPTVEGWLYLAGILDLHSRKVVGWAMGQNLDARLVLESWQMACGQRQPPAGLLFHSDRGSQYASAAFRNALKEQGAHASMSRAGNCYDNAAMESFWSTLKHELIYRADFRTRAQASAAIFEYIEVFYNRTRLHSSLNFLSPLDFENKNN
jgi:putative transposase